MYRLGFETTLSHLILENSAEYLVFDCPRKRQTVDISSGIRQSWEDIISLLIHCGLFLKNSMASNGFDIISAKLYECCDSFPPLTKLHYGEYKKRTELKIYYLCLGLPLYSNPAKQIKAIRQNKLYLKSLHFLLKLTES